MFDLLLFNYKCYNVMTILLQILLQNVMFNLLVFNELQACCVKIASKKCIFCFAY